VGDVVTAARDGDRRIVVDELLSRGSHIIHGGLHLGDAYRACELPLHPEGVDARIAGERLDHSVEA